MANPFITVNDLSVSLSGRRVIDGASFSVNPGEFIGLLGPNGAGKTTLMRAVLGLVPFTGTIDVTTSLGYVPQRHDVEWDFPISVAKAVLSGRTGLVGWFRRPGRLDKEAARRAIELTNLEEFARRPIAQLSGGQRQRVLIARALACEPEVLLLDEPFTGLDAPNTEELLLLFDKLTTDGTSVVMSTHNLSEAVHSCSRLVLFNRGIIADGPAETLRLTPQPWSTTFGVSASSPLLSAIGVAA
ncbi:MULTISPECIES: anchored repeat-type ABC transporter ATP-binding subunit [Corynebacterium]|uniref:Anchored repeat-type ABC transporter ATP-binding subunit n=2 Tax=Corynebacterium TaxID=1716 RepID=A0ABU9UIZ3_9CORY|nr:MULTISPECIES: anchored repeat-type ABC transporter ATP-binding subunit [unclassified Corynebacterium]MCG7260258.1 anchored repeat-type ABC transporter ATP-binding subunit [Corynebacterium aurimucosum]MCL8492880.1 anchored repeat-type ABC transporter ATP-binding subunit [Corynebacterium intestinale]MCZ9297726.1 anchored repeat-type ABC transporter ATP-binding subunit [Corynebacterium hesseae]MCP1389112.1 anchored repeat-type ABC transporter ATP-binding subunit [Corynebacterium intestinale]MD